VAHESEEVREAREWLTRFAESYGFTYGELMLRAKLYVESDEYWVVGGLFEGERVPDEFWDHYVAASGEDVPEDSRGSFFSCSC